MTEFFRTPIGSAITGAISIVIGIFIFAAIGWIEDPDAWRYVLGAIAGFVGGYFGGVLSQRRRNS